MSPITLKAMSLAAAMVFQADQECVAVDEAAVRSTARQVMAASRHQHDSTLGKLLADWSESCLVSRERASRALVMDLGRLLRFRMARFPVVQMLFEIRGNLRFARPFLVQALDHQERFEQQLVISRGTALSQSLRCLIDRIDGRQDRSGVDCVYLEDLRSSRD